MKIVEVTYTWPAETFIARHVKAVAGVNGAQLTVAAKSPKRVKTATIQDVTDNGAYNVVNLPNFDHISGIQKMIEAGKSVFYSVPGEGWRSRDKALIQSFADMKPDVIHFHFGYLAALMGHYAMSLDIPYTLSLRGSDIQVSPLDDKGYTARLVEAMEAAVGIHTVVDDIAHQARALAPAAAPITTIRTCLPIPDTTTSNFQPDAPLRFITVGRLHWRKAHDDLIRAMTHLEGATLDIIGDGPEKDHLAYLVNHLGLEDRVQIHGSLPYQVFQSMLLKSTAYVQSSIAEGFSNAVAEAMALGMPVFATDVGGTSEVITDGVNGIIIPEGDAAGMAEKLLQAKDHERMRALGREARATVERELTLEKHGQDFVGFYKRSLGVTQ